MEMETLSRGRPRRSRGRMATRPPRWCGTRCGGCLWQRCDSTGITSRSDGVTWTRMTAQPGSGLSALLCPSNPGSTGSIACPIYRGTLAVNSSTGDTFAWTVDANDQDQGLWQDQCALSGGACGNQAVTFAQRWSTAALRDQYITTGPLPSQTAVTRWPWPQSPRAWERDRIRCCWPAATICGSAAWPWDAFGAIPPTRRPA